TPDAACLRRHRLRSTAVLSTHRPSSRLTVFKTRKRERVIGSMGTSCMIAQPSYAGENEQPQVVQEYENGKVVPNQAMLAKMERVLGVKLRRKFVHQ
ncbi:multi -bridging factor 1c, partial [Olea europaea subsp. europaea]